MESLIKYIFSKMLLDRRLIPLIIFTMFGGLLSDLVLTYLLKISLELLEANAPSLLTPLYMFIGIYAVLTINIILWYNLARTFIFPEFDNIIGKELFEYILRHDYMYHAKHNSTKLYDALKKLYREPSYIIAMLTSLTGPTLLSMIVSPIYLYFVNQKYMWLLIGFIVMYFINLIIFIPYINKAHFEFESNELDNSKEIGEVIDNIHTIILYGARDHEIQNGHNMMNSAQQFLIASEAAYSRLYIAMHLCGTIFIGAIIYLSLGDLSKGLNASDFATILGIFTGFQYNLAIASWIICDVSKKFVRLQQAYKLILNANIPNNANAFGIVPIQNIQDIKFKDITFEYYNDNLLFNNLNLTIKSGSKVGIVGPSGSGKTSLVGLIYGLYKPKSGRILIGDIDLADVKESDYRAKVSSISQNPQVFTNRTILQNIQYNCGDKSLEDVIKAAELAGAAEFINKMKDGYNSKAFGLSNGQKQRIAIARAILHDGDLIIMDEATSAIDVITQKYIQDNLKLILKDKTAIVIAHRLSTVSDMDEIIVMDNGQIAQRGSHKELIKDESGIYFNLYSAQVDGYIRSENK